MEWFIAFKFKTSLHLHVCTDLLCIERTIPSTRGKAVFELLDWNIPESLDWREKGAVSEVKDQGHCGSCWAFSTTWGIEGARVVQIKESLVRVSEQCLVDCVNTCHGCDGGLMTTAISYIQKVYNGKISTEADYPYKSVQEVCRYDDTKAIGHVQRLH